MIIAHCLVKNEEKFIWYSISSVLDFVDEIIVWDTGSTDKTVEIIKSIKSSKVRFQERGEADAQRISSLRQEMLNETNAGWVMILDGDEIWYKNALCEVQEIVNQDKYNVIISPTKMLIGDIFHYQPEVAGRYKIKEKQGHYNLRFFKRSIVDHVVGNYPNEAYVNDSGIKLQDLGEDLFFAENFYLHASHLRRSSKDVKKIKYEIGTKFPLDFYYPEAFFLQRPKIISNVWTNMDVGYKFRASIETPLKKIKRDLIK